MNYFLFILKSAFEDFSRNKGRTFLTSLGILIGVSAVVLIWSFMLGLKIFIRSQFVSLGTNLVAILPGRAITQGGGFSPGAGTLGGVRFDEKDVVTVKKIEKVKYAAPFFVKTVKISSEGNSEIGDLRGTTTDAFVISHLEVEMGRLFDKKDLKKASKVVVLGSNIAEALFEDIKLAVGKKVKIDERGYSVIGILKPVGELSHFFDSTVFMPYTTAFTISADKKFFEIHAQAEEYSNVSLVKEKIKETLLKRYKEDDFSVVDQTEILKILGTLLNAVGFLLMGIAAVSLVVGGIGIMNIMYVTVTERIKEIGVRRALGARRSDILYQFLMESVILSLVGGLLGLGLAFVIVFFIQKIFPAYIDLNSIMLALGVSSLIGIVFGVFPAKKAADLSPIDAIRYE